MIPGLHSQAGLLKELLGFRHSPQSFKHGVLQYLSCVISIYASFYFPIKEHSVLCRMMLDLSGGFRV
jgi:hypothetical protein